MKTHYPSLYQINTRVWLNSLFAEVGHQVKLDQVPDRELDRIEDLGFDWVWLLGVWRTGTLGQQIALELPELREVYQQFLPNYDEEDVCGSPFAITAFAVSPDLGGDLGLTHLRDRLQARGIRLMLDFIPNHTARDHPWITLHPDYYVSGSEQELLRQPFNYGRALHGDRIFAFGRDPYFPGWSDTFQLNYGNPQLQSAMREELSNVATLCDGVRCDMAMLILPEVFNSTWGIDIEPFWPETIQGTLAHHPDFTFMAEVYWDLEWELQEQGFHYTYDKRLYDRLHEQEARLVREHLFGGLEFQSRSARFLENHDEPRAASAFPPQVHPAAATLTYLAPGLRLFHHGQLTGCQKRIPMQICRAPKEALDPQLWDLYTQLLELLKLPILREGSWHLLDCFPAWQSNWTWNSFVAFSWQYEEQERLLVVVNYSAHQSQCYVRLPWEEIRSRQVRFVDKMNGAEYVRDGDDLSLFGLYLDMPGWDSHIFDVSLE